jgi:hypothetical protein
LRVITVTVGGSLNAYPRTTPMLITMPTHKIVSTTAAQKGLRELA